MISLKEMRDIDPRFNEVTDEELYKIRYSYYSLVQLALESYIEKKTGSKHPIRVAGLNNEDMRD